MEHVLPKSHLELLQAILIELVLVRDPGATFEDPVVILQPEAKPAAIGVATG
jgi:hypothetical protein